MSRCFSLAAAVLVSAVAAAAMTVTSYAANTVELARISACISEQKVDNTEISVLERSRTVKAGLHIGADEFLVIPADSRLILKNGAQIDGNVFVENGAQLNVMGGELQINGAIVCDGKLTVNAKCDVAVNGDLIALPDGTVKLGNGAGFACGADANVVTGAEKAVACVVSRIDPFSGCMIESKLLTEQADALIPDKDDLYRAEQADGLAGAALEYVTIMLDNGSVIKAERTAEKYYSSINGVDIRAALIAIDNMDPETYHWELFDWDNDPMPAFLDTLPHREYYRIWALSPVNIPGLFTSEFIFTDDPYYGYSIDCLYPLPWAVNDGDGYAVLKDTCNEECWDCDAYISDSYTLYDLYTDTLQEENFVSYLKRDDEFKNFYVMTDEKTDIRFYSIVDNYYLAMVPNNEGAEYHLGVNVQEGTVYYSAIIFTTDIIEP